MKYKLKGFTLVELIVVMAIFSIIMFGALSLMTPSNKIMLNAENTENGSAAVNSIAKYLETELSTAEYLHAYGMLMNDADMKRYVEEYAGKFYGGVLQAESDPNSPNYGHGLVHVLQIDNTNEGQITKYDFTIDSFKPESTKVIVNAGVAQNKVYTVKANPGVEVSSVNKAYYDSYMYTIIPGRYATLNELQDKIDDYKSGSTSVIEETLNQINSVNTTFSIRATRRAICHECGQPFTINGDLKVVCSSGCTGTARSFLDVAAMSLVNIYERSVASVSGHYFVVQEFPETDPTTGLTRMVKKIVDRSTDPLDSYINIEAGVRYTPGPPGDDVLNGYTFIYSYGSEQVTKKP